MPDRATAHDQWVDVVKAKNTVAVAAVNTQVRADETQLHMQRLNKLPELLKIIFEEEAKMIARASQ